MSNYIVLVKQVPDVSQITDNAFDPETGNLKRAKLPSVINELDAQALALVLRMKELSGEEDAKVVALTMGPPMAQAVLRYSLSRGATQAVLLTDRELGGADTFATANPLAHATRKIVAELFGGDEDYYLVAGMQSVDGDTAQVPAQMAEELGISCIAYVTGVEAKNGRLEFMRIISGGSQVVAAKKLPAMMTVAKYEYAQFATVQSTRWANDQELIQWGADDVKATSTGVKGSKTQVIRVFPPPKTTRKRQEIATIDELAKIILDSYKSDGLEVGSGDASHEHYILPRERANKFDRTFEGLQKDREAFEVAMKLLSEMQVEEVLSLTDEQKAKLSTATGLKGRMLDNLLAGFDSVEPSYRGEVWVVAEHSEGTLHPATLELVGKARDLADSLGTLVGVAIAGDKVKHYTDELIAGGADKVYCIEHKLLAEFDPKTYQKVMAETIGQYWPQIVLFAATPQGRVLAPMVSYRLGCGLTADCTSLDIRDTSKKNQIAVLMQTRPALGGNVMATICTKDSRTQMATARPGVMQRLAADPSRKGEVIEQKVELSQDDLSLDIIKTERGSSDVNFNAEIIVSGGRGFANKEVYDKLVGQFCETVGEVLDVEVEKGASRAIVEQGYTDRAHQVGQTGTAVAPKIYIAMGISGAIQHMIGVSNSQTIIAINSDPNAPVFNQSDYYVVGNIEDIVPSLLEKLGANGDKQQ